MHMDRAIFDLRASVEATSLYILICALLDQQESPTLSRARVQWNGKADTIVAAAKELMQLGVLEDMNPFSEAKPLRVNPKSKWNFT